MAHGGEKFALGAVGGLGGHQGIAQVLGALDDADFEVFGLPLELVVELGLVDGDRQVLGNLLQ